LLAAGLLIALFAFGIPALAQGVFNPDDAIALAAAHPDFADLVARAGWTAAAYDSHNSYGIWRVQFWDENGEDAGWLDINPALARIYSWEVYYDSTPVQDAAALEVIEPFVRSHPDVLALLPGIAQRHDLYVDYDGWGDYWGVWVDAGTDALWLTISFDGGLPSSLENPTLKGIYFPYMLSYAEWDQVSRSEAVAIAFQQPEIADAVRAYADWTSGVEPVSGETWTVSFYGGGQTIAQATVDLAQSLVIDFMVFAS
ncbi:MAG: hypothetical protein K8I30_02895, partial [Anaerolineae bacterium]|nr:hypothetical protein [Anaerolineae bacterium]